MKKMALALCAASSLLSLPSHAESNFNYNYLGFRVGSEHGSLGVNISQAFHPNAYFFAEGDFDFEEYTNVNAGVGFNAPIGMWTDFYGRLSWRYSDWKEGSRDLDDNGAEFKVGVRQWITQQLEVGGFVGIFSGDSNDGIFGGHVNFHATELISLGASYHVNEPAGDTFWFDVRFNF
ncbi:hypothetical protein VST7929_01246 [Vibrio stylophorae]|uniref:Outer membrane protein beta-barrel domain-containing protein n=1 Tax=Vibrio stylophorae TaxID=659351 RepID=A0ABN8DU81_9VIBR|nr:hypothetical protein [Vibrio stylophorae]CAH0533380.1 hypothetical protein VST7929_01246 [Vibrio stylophorae]